MKNLTAFEEEILKKFRETTPDFGWEYNHGKRKMLPTQERIDIERFIATSLREQRAEIVERLEKEKKEKQGNIDVQEGYEYGIDKAIDLIQEGK